MNWCVIVSHGNPNRVIACMVPAPASSRSRTDPASTQYPEHARVDVSTHDPAPRIVSFTSSPRFYRLARRCILAAKWR